MRFNLRQTDCLFGGDVSAALLSYQLSVLKAEFDHLTVPQRKYRAPWVAFLLLHTRQFFWTVKRFIWGSQSVRQTVSFKEATAQRLGNGRLLLDVSSTFSSSACTGIQRVVKQFADASSESGVGVPVIIQDGQLLRADESETKLQIIDVQEGDILFLLDSNWRRSEALRSVIKAVQKRRCHVVAGLYDLIPIEHPSTCNHETVRDFSAWLDMALHTCDAFLCISATTAKALARVASACLDGRPTPPIGWFTLGGGFPNVEISSTKRDLEPRRRYVLMVGTLEPRKGHPIALEALEMLWKDGIDLDLMIIGRSGWKMQYFEDKLKTHPEINRRLIWVTDASDEDLVEAYSGASALIYPSIAEGYGLPIVEAASFGVKIIVSDLEIFREIAPPSSTFFKPCDANDLARSIRECLDRRDFEASIWTMPTWSQSVRDALRILQNRAYQIDETAMSRKTDV